MKAVVQERFGPPETLALVDMEPPEIGPGDVPKYRVAGLDNVELMRSLGACDVIDYTKDDFTDKRARYHVILDNVGNQSLSRMCGALTPAGILVLNAGGPPGKVVGPIGAMLRAAAVNVLVRQHLRFLPTREDRAELTAITGLIEDGKLAPVLDRTYPLAHIADGLRQVEQGHARGKVVIAVA